MFKILYHYLCILRIVLNRSSNVIVRVSFVLSFFPFDVCWLYTVYAQSECVEKNPLPYAMLCFALTDSIRTRSFHPLKRTFVGQVVSFPYMLYSYATNETHSTQEAGCENNSIRKNKIISPKKEHWLPYN